MLSFNGGKDCTVVLHLLHTFFKTNPCLQHIKIPTLYITDPDAFEEVDEFVEDCEKLFNIDLIRKPGPIKQALDELCKERPHLKAVFMGCRRTDPYCQDLKTLQVFFNKIQFLFINLFICLFYVIAHRCRLATFDAHKSYTRLDNP